MFEKIFGALDDPSKEVPKFLIKKFLNFLSLITDTSDAVNFFVVEIKLKLGLNYRAIILM